MKSSRPIIRKATSSVQGTNQIKARTSTRRNSTSSLQRKKNFPPKGKDPISNQEKTELHVPKRYVKFIIALFLLPVAWSLTQAFFGAFAWVAIEKNFWLTEEFWFFGLGALLWLILFFVFPGLVIVYVFGHELCHAVAVLLSGGRVQQFHFARSGGYVISDRINTWIALAPYFIPIYSIIVILTYLLAAQFYESKVLYYVFLGTLGFTCSFHISYTLWVIPKGQTDIFYGGTFFSLVLIYIVNLIIFSALLIIGSKDISLYNFIDLFLSALVTLLDCFYNLLKKALQN
ncbi:MAG: hypothetical protein N2035_05480 [Chthoniobacterales bacterium]|nr:hypothetical protein [Chthoniobacterales bacterium]